MRSKCLSMNLAVRENFIHINTLMTINASRHTVSICVSVRAYNSLICTFSLFLLSFYHHFINYFFFYPLCIVSDPQWVSSPIVCLMRTPRFIWFYFWKAIFFVHVSWFCAANYNNNNNDNIVLNPSIWYILYRFYELL